MKIVFVLLSGSTADDYIDLNAVRYKLDTYNLVLLLRRFDYEHLQNFSLFNKRIYELENIKLLFDDNERNLINEYTFITNTLERWLINNKLTFLSYITVLEFLLTTKPDDSGYDESINRQFIKNTMICISLMSNNKSKEEFKNLKRELREIYDYSSNIVHGNFDKLKGNLNKIKKFEFYKEQNSDILGLEDQLIIIRLSQILKVVLKSWLNYPLLFDIFKNR